jgi:hypothetical protein
MNIQNDKNNLQWISTDKLLLEDPEYLKIISLIHHLWSSGLVQRGTGHCYSMSDIIQKLLKHYGIDCYLEECSLMILKKNPPEIHLVGYQQESSDVINDKISEVQTHVVCVSKTKYPLLIDLSISDYIEGVPFICERIGNTNSKLLLDKNEICNLEYENAFFKYSKQISVQVPSLHQQSIVERIKTDKKIFNSIKRINVIVSFLIIISSLNFVRGVYDHYQKYIVKDNGFGPNKIHYEHPQHDSGKK